MIVPVYFGIFICILPAFQEWEITYLILHLYNIPSTNFPTCLNLCLNSLLAQNLNHGNIMVVRLDAKLFLEGRNSIQTLDEFITCHAKSESTILQFSIPNLNELKRDILASKYNQLHKYYWTTLKVTWALNTTITPALPFYCFKTYPELLGF